MDYETFLNSYRTIYEDFISYIDNSINKNVLKAEEIVKDYLSETALGNYSLKSYKAKIIRNEQEHHQTDNDIEFKCDSDKEEIYKILEKYFDEFFSLDKSKYESNSKIKDLKIILLDLRRKRQELVSKRNTLEKEMSQLKRENDNILQLSEKQLKADIKDLKRNYKLKIDEIDTITTSNYLNYESKLLSCNDLTEITNLKNEIYKHRKAGLDKKKVIELSICKDINDKYDSYIKKSEENLYNYKKDNISKKKEVIDIEYQLKQIDISITEKTKNYEFEFRRKFIQDYSECLHNLIDNINIHNNYLKQTFYEYTYKDKAFLFDIVNINYNYFLYQILENDEIEDLIYFIRELISEVSYAKEKYIDLYEKNTISLENYKKALLDALEPIKDSLKENAEDFITNVITSLKRFYENLFKQIDIFYNQYFVFMMDICNKIFNIYKGKVNISYLQDSFLVTYSEYNYGDISKYSYKLFDRKAIESTGLSDRMTLYYEKINENINMIDKNQIVIAREKQKNLDKEINIATKEITKHKKQIDKEYNNNIKINIKENKDCISLFNKNMSRRLDNNKKYTRFKQSSANNKYILAVKNL